MKRKRNICLCSLALLDIIIIILVVVVKNTTVYIEAKRSNVSAANMLVNGTESLDDYKNKEIINQPRVEIVYDNMTLEQLSQKLDNSLKSTMSGKGSLIASYALEKGVDPYMATAIILLETGCNHSCSKLVITCNNVGGQKGSGCGAYRSYPTLDDGIRGFIDNLYNNYVSRGLTTPETIGPKYAASGLWSTKVNRYINVIKAN